MSYLLEGFAGSLEGFAGRVAPGNCSPGAPTDPDVQISCIRLVTSCRCAAEETVDHTCTGKRVALRAELGRVDLGGCPPRSPTDPGLHITRTRFLIS